MPQVVLFDTNFLLIPVRFHVDIYSETINALNEPVEFTVPSTVMDEIKALKQRSKPKFVKELSLAEKIAEKCRVIPVTLGEDETVDDSILRVASLNGYVVGTTDAELRRRLRLKGLRVLVLRQRQYIEVA